MTILDKALLSVVLLGLSRCAPTEVIDLRNAPQATRDAMLRVSVLPLGKPAPPGVGSIGPIVGYGCASTTEAAERDAVEQLQAKALAMHATAVVDVLVAPEGTGLCFGGQNMVARGIAVGPRGVPPSY